MKKLLTILSFVLLAICVQAQTNSSITITNQLPVDEQTFFSSAESYLTSFNPEFTFTNVVLEVGTGYKQVTGVNAASTLDAQYDFERWNVGSAFQFSGVGSAVNAIQAQGGYAIIEHLDTKVDLDLRPGYDFVRKTEVIEPALFISKKMSKNTFLRPGISFPIYFKGRLNTSPTFFFETGFTY
jgi:hypothetical protein